MKEAVLNLLASKIVEEVADREVGHCIRVDNLAEDEAKDLCMALRRKTNPEVVKVAVLATRPATSDEIDVFTAVALRNDKDYVFVLLVHERAAEEASSLDNSFERLSLVHQFTKVAADLEKRLEKAAPNAPIAGLRRAVGGLTSVEQWIDFFSAVLEEIDEPDSFGSNLWRVGAIPHRASNEEVRAALQQNGKLVRSVAAPTRVTATPRERVIAAGVAPDEVLDKVVDLINQAESSSSGKSWIDRAHLAGLDFAELSWAVVATSALTGLTLVNFRSAAGKVEAWSKLKETDDGALFCEVPDDGAGTVGLRWKTVPGSPEDVGGWLVELLPPEDLRLSSTEVIIATRVPSSRRSTKIAIDVTAEDLESGALFVLRISALGPDGIRLALADGSEATAESEQFELVFVDGIESDKTRNFSSASMPEAQLRAILAGANSTDVDMISWDRAGQVLTARIGGRSITQIRLPTIPVALEQLIRNNPAVVSLSARSKFGEAIDLAAVDMHAPALPKAFLKRRKEMFDSLAGRSTHSVASHPWTDSDRTTAREYVASYRKFLQSPDAEVRAAMQRIDTVELSVGHATGDINALLVLPIHPLRIAWFAALSGVLDSWTQQLIETLNSPVSRAKVVDIKLVERVTPVNLPFSVATAGAVAYTYFDELSVGTGILLRTDSTSPEAAATTVSLAMGIARESRNVQTTGAMLESRTATYRRSHPSTDALRIAVVNPGTGQSVAQALASTLEVSMAEKGEVTVDQPNVSVVAYGDGGNYFQPIEGLAALQRRLRSIPTRRGSSHLTPPLGLAHRPVERVTTDTEGFHLSIVQDIASQSLIAARASQATRLTAFFDLLTPLVTTRQSESGPAAWATGPALHARGDGLGSVLVEAHRLQQSATGEVLALGGPPALAVQVGPADLAALRSLHQRSDWVLTLDRYVGLDFYEDPLRSGLSDENFVLDYAPDFIEGLSHRLTVTTAHRSEVERILGRAMDELGLAEVNNSVSPILGHLMAVSGRLVLRLQSSDSFAREAVSLAAVMAHLKMRGELEDAIVVPVDAHDEIFGRAARNEDESARRCDMLIVKVTSRSMRIECVEVKSRQAAALPMHLAEGIAEQLRETKGLLENRYFASDPPRVDRSLQRARLAGLLHYYADRAVTNGLLDEAKIEEVHRNLDKHLDSDAPTELSMRGFVISLGGSAGFPKKVDDIPIAVLTAEDLGRAGFSTKFDAYKQDEEKVGSVDPVTSPGASAVPDQVPGPDQPETPPSGEDAQQVPTSEMADNASGTEMDKSFADRRKGPVSSAHVQLGVDANGSEVKWSISTQGSPHAFILGIPGQGKSVTTRRIVREFSEQGLPSLLFDFHGDMASDPPAGAAVLDAGQGLPFSPFEPVANLARDINVASWEIAEIMAYVASLGEIQRGNVYRALQDAYAGAHTGDKELTAPTMERFAAALEEVESAGRGKNARERLRTLTDFGLFAETQTAGEFDPRLQGMVVDLSGLNLEEVQRAGGAFLLRRIYRDMFTWPQDSTLKLAIVLDEAHRMARDVTLPKLMKEGRKYGIAILVASQGIADFHRDVLGNAGTKIVFRTNYPASRPVASLLRGRAGQDLSEQIEKLGVGQAYVATPDSPRARRVDMRK